ncbi:MAG TPA: CocE/NonD family hydrolase [Bryobacteraceae bacterium]|nr:CocE/NonD family hydrolase [Bryobacteraceae bacterium]
MKVLLTASLIASACFAQGLDYIRTHYTKYEYRIAMRDGKKLFTSVYAPKDTLLKYPIMLDRTPYNVGPYGVDNYKTALGPSEKFARAGFIFVYQDVRGRFLSEGEFVNMTPQIDHKRGPQDVDESSDTYDTIDWLVKNVPGNNGKVGMWGISYPGFYTAAGVIDAHPALKAASPQAPINDWFVGDDFHHNGALYLPHAFRFFSFFGHPRPAPTLPPPAPPAASLPDAYSFFLSLGPLSNANEKEFKNDVAFWNEMMQHGTYDEFWQARDLRRHLKNIKPAVMTVGGWFDAEDLFGALHTYQEIEKNSPGASNILVMGPWYHGGWARSDGDTLGAVRFGSKTAQYYRDEIELPFFNYWLKGKDDPKLAEATVFETGTNQWRREDAWPPRDARAKTLYLHAGGALSFDPPRETGAAFDEYVSDPAKPVPYISGQASGMTREHMVEDQRFASTRTDVLTYQTEELAEDVTFAGPLSPSLFVSTTGTDSDWVVKLIDVYPEDYPDPDPNPAGLHMGGYQQLVRGEIFRGKFRNSFSKPEPFVPGKTEKVEYVMPDINHCFRQGHRIMIQVQSSWFPLADRNPQKFVDIYNAKASDFGKATQHVYRSAGAASGLKVYVRGK